jgi:flavin reductase (DIM6/NTAB) family NADH-FMN oxidoreductase RutF
MSEPSPAITPTSPLAQALGRVPSGLYILTVRQGEQATGMLASWVQQAGFNPPMLTVAVGTNRFVADWIAGSGRFVLNQLPHGSKPLIRHFGRGFPPGVDAFEGLTILREGQGGPILDGSLAYLELEVAGEMASGDHRVFLARVVEGAMVGDADQPLVHVRGNGLHY